MNQQSIDICLTWASQGDEVKYSDVNRLLERHHGRRTLGAVLDLLPKEYQDEYAGALHLRVSGEWSIHPSTAFKTLNAPTDVMVDVLVKLLLAHPECRPTLPKGLALAPEAAATGSERASAASTSPAGTEAGKGIP